MAHEKTANRDIREDDYDFGGYSQSGKQEWAKLEQAEIDNLAVNNGLENQTM